MPSQYSADVVGGPFCCRLLCTAFTVAPTGNSLAVRLPAAVIDTLALKEGDDIEIVVAGERRFEVQRKPTPAELLARLRAYRGRLPADFRFDRLDAHEDRG